MSSSNEIRELTGSIEDLTEVIEDLKTSLSQDFFSEVSNSANSLNSDLLTLSNNFGMLGNNMKDTKMFGNMTESLVMLSTAFSGISTIIPAVCMGFDALCTIGSMLNETFRDKSLEKYYESCQKVGEGIATFVEGIENARSIFDGFNMGMAYSSDEVQKLNKNIDQTQRSMYELGSAGESMTEEQQALWDKQKIALEEYYDKELEYAEKGQEIVKARAQSFTLMEELSEEEMQTIIHNAQTEKDEVIAKINEQYDEELALLNLKFSQEKEIDEEAWKEQLEALNARRDGQIEAATKTCGDTIAILTDHYAQQTGLDTAMAEANDKYKDDMLKAEAEYDTQLKSIENDRTITVTERFRKQGQLQESYRQEKARIYEETYGDLLKSKNNEIAVLMSLAAETSLYGGELNRDTEANIGALIDKWDSLPEDTKNVMKNVLEPMLEEMKKKEPILYKKADSISGGILSRFKKAFDIHSPSRKTRAIFHNLMEGCELGLEDEAPSLYRKTDHIADGVLSRMSKQAKGMNVAMEAAIQAEVSYKGMGAAVNESRLKTLNRLSASQGIIHTTIDIDGREFAIATSGYIAEEMAFAR